MQPVVQDLTVTCRPRLELCGFLEHVQLSIAALLQAWLVTYTCEKMQVEHERVKHTERAKDDLQFSLEEKIRKVDAAHTKILQDTMAAYDQ